MQSCGLGYVGGKPKFSDKSHDLMASFQIAVNKKLQDCHCQLTDWYDVICVKQLTDFTERVLKKGMLVYVQARPAFDE